MNWFCIQFLLLPLLLENCCFAADAGSNWKTDLFTSKLENSPAYRAAVAYSTEAATVSVVSDHKMERYQVASFDFDHVAAPFIIAAWIFAACCAKIAFHVSPKLASYCPESCMLLIVGVILGLVLFHSGSKVGPLTPTVFFMYMLPPIVFDAGYFMPNRLFFDNYISILVYAVIGTVWNALTIGVTLWAIGLTGLFSYKVPLMDMLLFSSIVSAVDPVAVLAVFEEIHVNEVLYIIVFGESLLNDAVTVVLYHMFEGYTEMGIDNILPIDYFSGVASFFVVSLGGTFIGIIFGFLTSFLSRYTTPVAVIEPMFPFIMGYLAYLFAEMFHLSGILSLVFCGITMKNYVEENISHKSHVTVKYVTKMMATASEAIIFVVLGVSTVNDNHEWDTWFVFCTIFFCSLYRALGVAILTAFLNRYRLHQINGVEQFIMAYGGLRGAVAFALALIIKEELIPAKHMFVTTVIAVVYFTVFVQGMTIKFFVRILKVPRKREKEISMNERLHSTVIDHIMGGIEEVTDQFFGNHAIRDRFKYYNNKYLRRFLTNHSEVNEPKIIATHSKLNIIDAMNIANSGSKVTLEADAPLSAVLRNYTQVNLTKLAPDELSDLTPNMSPLLNIDMGEITYNPSFKDLADSEIHHILEDAMFKPPKRSRRYSRSQFYECYPKHPPFHHHMRMQIRRLVSENRRHRKKNRSQSTVRPLNGSAKNHISTIYLNSDNKHPGVTITSPECDEDECIMFTAKSSSLDSSEAPIRTVTETVLPWKRDDGQADCDPAKPQEEFPAWVNNREYYPGYLSPTHTFLERIGDRPHLSSDVRSIVHESIDEGDESEEAFTTEFQKSSVESKYGDIRGTQRTSDSQRRFVFDQQQFVDEPIVVDSNSKQCSPSGQRKRWLFKHSSKNSPDHSSTSSGQSDSTHHLNSSDTVSIECPDVAVDIETDGGADTKL